MSCNCLKQSQERLSYENIKTLAIKFAALQNVELYIYKTAESIYSFAPIEEETFISKAIEFISPVQ